MDEVLKITEAAALLKVGRNTVTEMVKSGRLRGTYMVIGKNRLRFRRDKLLSYIGTEVYDFENIEIDCEDDEQETAGEAT